MKKSITFLFMLSWILILSTAHAQSWQLQSTGTTENLNSISFRDAQNGYCVGNGGVVLGTTSGGINWNKITVGSSNLRGVATPCDSSEGRVFICDDNGTVFFNEGGSQFFSQTTGVTTALNDIKFLANDPTGVAVGENGTVISTGNNGETWQKYNNVPTNVFLTKVDMFSATEWRVVGENGIVLVTHNGGTTWSTEQLPSTPFLGCVKYTGADQGWISGSEGALYLFEGVHTSQYLIGTTNGIMGLDFVTPNFGFGVGDNGYIINWDGNTWNPQQGPNTQWLTGVAANAAFEDNGKDYEVRAWACGLEGTILSTVQSVVGFNQPSARGEIRISPNPVSGVCRISGLQGQTAIMRLIDISGRIAGVFMVTDGTDVNLGSVAPGLYTAMITAGQKMQRIKIVISPF